MSTTTRRKRRTTEEQIRDLQQEIERLKAKKQTKKSAARKQARLGLRSLEKALPMALEESDGELGRVLEKAIGSLSTCLIGGEGGGRVRRTAEELEALKGQTIGFLVSNSSSSISEIAEALDRATAGL